jgi:hypothetical protein
MNFIKISFDKIMFKCCDFFEVVNDNDIWLTADKSNNTIEFLIEYRYVKTQFYVLVIKSFTIPTHTIIS